MTDKAGYPQAAFGGDTIRTVTLNAQGAGDALANLVRDALIFANWAGGEGLCPDGIPSPEEFMMRYSDATGDEDWDTFAERISASIRALSMPAPAPAQAWRDISTAPKDGVRFLAIRNGDVDSIRVCWFYFNDWDGYDVLMDDADSEPFMTHWMPAPPRPVGLLAGDA